MSKYPTFNRAALQLRGLGQRGHDMTSPQCLDLAAPSQPYVHPEFSALVAAIQQARRKDRPVIAMMGGHPIKLGLSRFIVDLIERRIITHLATNGAGVIHDFELAAFEGTSEDVARWIQIGQFGLWQETSQLNEICSEAAERDEGLAEAVGRVIETRRLPSRQLSVCAAGFRCGTPVTSHVSVGSDIIHAMANCDGAALGKTSHTDFLIFANSVQDLEGGVFLNIGTAVTGPEVFLKALSMARNVARQQNEEIRHFTTAVFDLVDLPASFRKGPPGKDHPLYYYRPWKTLLCRTVADGGSSYYFRGDHTATLPTLWQYLANDPPAVRQE